MNKWIIVIKQLKLHAFWPKIYTIKYLWDMTVVYDYKLIMSFFLLLFLCVCVVLLSDRLLYLTGYHIHGRCHIQWQCFKEVCSFS